MRWPVMLLLACAGGESKESNKPDTTLSCEDAVANFTRDRDKKADLVKRCIEDEWPRRMRRCVSEAEGNADLRACEEKHDVSDPSAEMTRWADEVCACKTADCAQKIYDEALKASRKNEGKSVSESAAKRYVKAGQRLSNCMQDLSVKATPNP